MKKSFLALSLAAVMACGSSITANAGYWYSDQYDNWYYNTENGNVDYKNGWYWINEKCYYFKDGVVYQNGTTPDGYTVDMRGAWTENGVVQVKAGENLDYCKNVLQFGSSAIVFSVKVTDCGDYYDVEGEIYPEYPEGGSMLPTQEAHIRLRKTATVHWNGSANISLNEYAQLFTMSNTERSLIFVRMSNMVLDKDGYVVEFSDWDAG